MLSKLKEDINVRNVSNFIMKCQILDSYTNLEKLTIKSSVG